MKERVSATIDKATAKKLEQFLKEGRYRNKSHFLEEAILKLIKEGGEDDKK